MMAVIDYIWSYMYMIPYIDIFIDLFTGILVNNQHWLQENHLRGFKFNDQQNGIGLKLHHPVFCYFFTYV
jgi:hypothetical protein